MAGIIKANSPEHKAHLAGVEIDKVATKQSEANAEKRAVLKTKISNAKPNEKQALVDELARLDNSNSDYLEGFKLGANRQPLEKECSSEKKSGYADGLSASKYPVKTITEPIK